MPSRNGIFQQFDDNGTLWLQEYYKNGRRDGECKFWNSNGRCWQREFYQDGKREGEVKLWYADGIPHIKFLKTSLPQKIVHIKIIFDFRFAKSYRNLTCKLRTLISFAD